MIASFPGRHLRGEENRDMSVLRSAIRQLFLPNGLALLGAALLVSWKTPRLFAPPTGPFIALTLLFGDRSRMALPIAKSAADGPAVSSG